MNDPKFKPPSEALVERALLRLGDLQARRVFYERLENPLWVAPLRAAGAFASAPELQTDEEGYVHSRPWPEGDYLVRVAERAPEEVAEILAVHATSANPYVLTTIVRAAVRLPAPQSKRMVPAVKALAHGQFSQLLDPELVAPLISVLADGGEVKAAERVAHNIFRPRPAGSSSGSERVRAGLEGYWYARELPAAITALTHLGNKVLNMLGAWLETYQEISGSWTRGSEHDTSYIWRPAISHDGEESRYHDIGDALIDAVRDLATAQIAGGRPLDETLTVMTRGSCPLLQRIALHTLANALEHDGPETVAVGVRFAMNPRYVGAEYRPEYCPLLRTLLPRMSDKQREEWSAWVLDGPPIDNVELERRAARLREPGTDSPVQLYRDYWQLSVLGEIGSSSLPPKARQRLEELERVHGPFEQPQRAATFATWSGNESPLSADELANMSPSDVLTFASRWSPAPDLASGHPTLRGLGDALKSAISLRASPFSEVATKVIGADPTIVRALLGGLEAAVTEGTPIDWDQVLELSGWVVQQSDGGSDDQVDFDRDTVWRYAQRAVASLLAEAAKMVDPAINPPLSSSVIQLVGHLMTHPDPTREHEATYGGTNMDPLTLSLNTTRPGAVRSMGALARLAKRQSDRGDSAAAAALTEAMGELKGRFGPEKDSSLAVAAVYGELIGLLATTSEPWLLQALSALPEHADGGEYEEVLVTTALGLYSPAKWLLRILRSSHLRLIARSQIRPLTVGWRSQRTGIDLIGDHLYVHIISGTIANSDPLVDEYVRRTDVDTRGSVLSHLGWSLSNSEEVEVDIVQGSMALWDWRRATVTSGDTSEDELVGFYWWVKSGKFEESWWLPRLIEVAKNPNFQPMGMIGQALEDAAVRHPSESLTVLASLLGREHDKHFTRHDLLRHAPAVIAAALSANRKDVTDAADELMNALARQGNLTMRDQVEQVQTMRRQRDLSPPPESV